MVLTVYARMILRPISMMYGLTVITQGARHFLFGFAWKEKEYRYYWVPGTSTGQVTTSTPS